MKNKKILLIGHTGFVGNEVFQVLEKKKIKFNCYSRREIIINSKIIKNFNKQSLTKLILQSNVIINCAGENLNQNKMAEKNFKFVCSILLQIEKNKKKTHLIHLSSCAVYGKYFHFKNYIIDQISRPSPISLYAKTKLKADEAIIKSNIKNFKYSIIRPSQVVGFNMNATGFINLAKFIKKRLFVYVSNKDAIRNYVDSEDLSNLIYLLCFKKKIENKIYLVSRYSRLRNIVKYIEKRQKINTYFDIVIPKFFLIFVTNIIKIFKKDFLVNKEIIEGLSITAKIKSNYSHDFKSINLKNINTYLTKIT